MQFCIGTTRKASCSVELGEISVELEHRRPFLPCPVWLLASSHSSSFSGRAEQDSLVSVRHTAADPLIGKVRCSCSRVAAELPGKLRKNGVRGASSGGAARHGWQEHRHRAQACKFCARVMSCLSRRRFQLAIEQRSSSARRGHECVRLHRNRRGLARAMVGSLSPPNRANRCLKRKTPVATRLILAAQPGSDEREEPVGGRYFIYRPPWGSPSCHSAARRGGAELWPPSLACSHAARRRIASCCRHTARAPGVA